MQPHNPQSRLDRRRKTGSATEQEMPFCSSSIMFFILVFHFHLLAVPFIGLVSLAAILAPILLCLHLWLLLAESFWDHELCDKGCSIRKRLHEVSANKELAKMVVNSSVQVYQSFMQQIRTELVRMTTSDAGFEVSTLYGIIILSLAMIDASTLVLLL